MIASQSILAKKYAKAYLRVYADKLKLVDIQALEHFVIALKKNKNIMLLICAAGISVKDKLKVVDTLFRYFDLHVALQKLVSALLYKNRLCFLTQILQDLCCLYKEQHNIVDLRIVSAGSLDEQEVKTFEKFFAEASGKQLVVTTSVDPDLIAGVRLESNMFLWEYSVASRLRTLQHKLFVKG